MPEKGRPEKECLKRDGLKRDGLKRDALKGDALKGDKGWFTVYSCLSAGGGGESSLVSFSRIS